MIQGDFKDNISEIYALDQARRERLGELLQPVLDGQTRLGMASDAGDTAKLADLIAHETFKILVIGEFNVGKSTFINALIGEDALPTKAIPATAIINVLRYGESKKARLHFKEQGKTPLDIPVEELPKHVLIQGATEEEAASAKIRETPYSHAEIWWPLDLLKHNKVEIIDSPGLNENKVREDITLGYLKRVDAVLFLMSAARFGPAQTEMESIEALKSAEHKDVFFVVNQWDMLRLRQQEEVKTSALNVLPTLTERKNGIFFVSALDALEGRTENKPELEHKSSFKDFEAELHRFLALEKGKVKMLRSARELRRIIRETLATAIPEKIALMKMPLGELEKRYEDTQVQLKKLREDQKGMLDFMGRKRTQITGHTESKVKEFFFEVEDRIEGWAESFDLSNYSWEILSQVSAVVKALGEHLKNKLEEAFEEWAKDDLMPKIEADVNSLRKDLDRLAARFEERLQEAHFTLSGIEFDPSKIAGEFGPSSPLERLLAAAGGWFIGGIGAGAIGAVFGWKEMLRGLIPNVGAIIAAMLIGIPVLPAILVASTIYGVYAYNKIGGKLKAKVAEKFKDGLRAARTEQARKVADKFDSQLSELQEALRSGTDSQIAHLKDLADTAQADRKKEQGELDQKLAEIEAFKAALEKTEQDLEDFIEDMLAGK